MEAHSGEDSVQPLMLAVLKSCCVVGERGGGFGIAGFKVVVGIECGGCQTERTRAVIELLARSNPQKERNDK